MKVGITEASKLMALMLVAAWVGLGMTSCAQSPSNSGVGPSPAATATPTSGPTVTAVGTTFSPASLTISSGTIVTFNVPGHTVNIDDSAIGSCGNTDLTSFPSTHTFTAASGTDFKIHCDFHSCGASFCPASCSGMVMNIHIL